MIAHISHKIKIFVDSKKKKNRFLRNEKKKKKRKQRTRSKIVRVEYKFRAQSVKEKVWGAGVAIIESVETLSRNSPLPGRGKSDESRILSGLYRDNLEFTYSCRPCRILCPGELDFWRRGYNERHAESVSNSGQRFLS